MFLLGVSPERAREWLGGVIHTATFVLFIQCKESLHQLGYKDGDRRRWTTEEIESYQFGRWVGSGAELAGGLVVGPSWQVGW